MSMAKKLSNTIGIALFSHMFLYVVSTLVLGYIDGIYKYIFSLLFTIIRLIVPMLIIRFSKNYHGIEFTKRKSNITKGKNLILIIYAFAIISIFGFFYSAIFEQNESAYGFVKFGGVIEQIIGIASITIVPAIFEEIFMRMLILGGIERFNRAGALIISSLLFALSHFSLVTFPYAFISGLIIGYVFIKAGNLISPILTHFLINLLSYIFYILRFILEPKIYTISIVSILAFLIISCIIFTPTIIKIVRDTKDVNYALTEENETNSLDLISLPLMIYVLLSVIVTILMY